MTFANVGYLVAQPGQRQKVIEILTRPNPELAAAGCLSYEVGTNQDTPDTVYVTELWESEQHHQNSLSLDSVRAAIAEAMPMLTGEMGGHRFQVKGSPLGKSGQ